jgi:hypothetical protein
MKKHGASRLLKDGNYTSLHRLLSVECTAITIKADMQSFKYSNNRNYFIDTNPLESLCKFDLNIFLDEFVAQIEDIAAHHDLANLFFSSNDNLFKSVLKYLLLAGRASDAIKCLEVHRRSGAVISESFSACLVNCSLYSPSEFACYILTSNCIAEASKIDSVIPNLIYRLPYEDIKHISPLALCMYLKFSTKLRVTLAPLLASHYLYFGICEKLRDPIFSGVLAAEWALSIGPTDGVEKIAPLFYCEIFNKKQHLYLFLLSFIRVLQENTKYSDFESVVYALLDLCNKRFFLLNSESFSQLNSSQSSNKSVTNVLMTLFYPARIPMFQQHNSDHIYVA